MQKASHDASSPRCLRLSTTTLLACQHLPATWRARAVGQVIHEHPPPRLGTINASSTIAGHAGTPSLVHSSDPKTRVVQLIKAFHHQLTEGGLPLSTPVLCLFPRACLRCGHPCRRAHLSPAGCNAGCSTPGCRGNVDWPPIAPETVFALSQEHARRAVKGPPQVMPPDPDHGHLPYGLPIPHRLASSTAAALPQDYGLCPCLRHPVEALHLDTLSLAQVEYLQSKQGIRPPLADCRSAPHPNPARRCWPHRASSSDRRNGQGEFGLCRLGVLLWAGKRRSQVARIPFPARHVTPPLSACSPFCACPSLLQLS